MSQLSVSDFEYAGKRKQTRRERFLAEMGQVVRGKVAKIAKAQYLHGTLRRE